jgi:hypothetical protein
MTELERLLSQDDCCLVSVASIKKALEQEPCEAAISRAEAIKRVSECLKGVFVEYEDIARKMFAEDKVPPVQPKIKTGHWIPISERLSIYGKEVLTCSNGGFIEIQSLEDGGYWENQKGDWTDFDEVIAWMPLPEPYESQESEG